MFKVGEKVVCIAQFDIDEEDVQCGVKVPIKDEIYTIREIVEYNQEFCIGIRLEEIINPKLAYKDGFGEVHFNLKKFRKLEYSFGEEICTNLNKIFNLEKIAI